MHKKSTPYSPQVNGLAESTNKTLQNILKKIVNDNRIEWDTKLQSALLAYRTSFKTNTQTTPFRLAFGLETVMPVEFQIPSLRIQIRECLLETQSEQLRLQQLLELGENMALNIRFWNRNNGVAKHSSTSIAGVMRHFSKLEKP